MAHTLAALVCVATLAARASGQAVQRPNPSECIGPNQSVNLTRLAESLGDRTVKCTGNEECTFRVDIAKDFSIEYYPDYKVVWNNYTDTPYATVLYPCGTDKPSASDLKQVEQAASGVAYFPLPLYAVATDDSTTSWALDFLDLTDRVRWAPALATSPCMLKVGAPKNESGCGRMFVAPNDEFATAPPTPEKQYDAWITFAVQDEYNPKLKQIPFTAPADPTPLGRTEGIVYMGAFFNLEAEAAATVRTIAQSYNNLKTKAGGDAPTVLWVQYLDDVSLYELEGPDGKPVKSGDGYQVSFATYKVLLTADAGAAVVPANQVERAETADAVLPSGTANSGQDVTFASALYGSQASLLEQVHGILEGVDILIDETYIPPGETASKSAFLKAWNIGDGDADNFPFLANDQLWRHDKRVTAGGSDDWFGQAVIRPDLVLEDLRKIVAPGQNKDHDFVFFRNIAASGAEARQSIISKDQCSGLSCDSWADQRALPIVSMTSDSGDVSSDDAGSGSDRGGGGNGGGSSGNGNTSGGGNDNAAPRSAASAAALLLSVGAGAAALL